MEDNKMEYDKPVDYRVHESMLARLENINKRLFLLLIVVFTALILTNIAWIIYENQFEDTVAVTQDVDTQNSPAYVNGTGEMTVNGEDKTNNNKNKTP